MRLLSRCAAALLLLIAAADGASAQSDQTFQAWRLDCSAQNATSDMQNKCLIEQMVTAPNDKTKAIMVARIRFFGVERRAIMAFLLPPGMPMGTQVSYAIDGGAPGTTSITDCKDWTCVAVVALNDDLLDRMKRGQQLAVTYGGASKPVAVSLAGFSDAMAALQRGGS